MIFKMACFIKKIFGVCCGGGKNLLFLVAAFLCAMLPEHADAQYYSIGNNPASVKWDYIITPHYKFIYPREMDSLARNYASLMESCRSRVVRPLGIDPEPLPVVLHPYNAASNGLVVWTPKRMELFTMPPSEGYSQPWPMQLALHETRHVAQTEMFARGWIRPFSWFLGEQAPGLAAGLFGSKWLFEGDAVVSETELSRSGRGREASFLQFYRMSFLNGDVRNWDRWRFGSFYRHTPDVYALGYLVSSAARIYSGKYGYLEELIPRFMNRWYYFSYFMTESYKEVVGLSYYGLLDYGRNAMTKIWKNDLLSMGKFTYRNEYNVRKRLYTDYLNVMPVFPAAAGKESAADGGPESVASGHDAQAEACGVNDHEPKAGKRHRHEGISGDVPVYALSSGTDEIPELVRIEPDCMKEVSPRQVDSLVRYILASDFNGRKKKRLRKILNGYYQSWVECEKRAGEKTAGYMSYSADGLVRSGKYIYWTENVPDLRWENVNYSDIFRFDTETGKRKRLTSKKYYFNVSLPASGDTLFVSEYRADGSTALALIDPSTGKEMSSFGLAPGAQLKETAVAGKYIFFSAVTSRGTGIYRCHKDSLSRLSLNDTVLSPVNYKIEDLAIDGESLYFTTDYDGVNNIYSISDGKFFKLTNSLYGAEDPCVFGGRLYYSEYNMDGYNPAVVPLDSCLHQEKDPARPYRHKVADYLSLQAGGPVSFDNMSFNADTIEAKPYKRGLSLWRIHSWAPVYYNPDRIMSMSFDRFYEAASLGAVVFSQNTLSTAETMLGYSYHNGFHSGHLKFSYTGFYPVFELTADLNDRKRICHLLKMEDGSLSASDFTDGKPYFNLGLNVYVPLNFSYGGWQRGLIPQLTWNFSNDGYWSYQKNRWCAQHRLLAGARYYQMLPVAKTGIFPRWGFSVSGYYSAMPGSGENFGSMAYLYAYGYLPGAISQHGIRLSFSFQRQFLNGKAYYQGNMASMPRGYASRPSEMYIGGTFDYAVPVYLGDVSLWKLAYLKRLQIIPFADYGRSYTVYGKAGGSSYENLWSVGADFILDANFLHISWPVSVGVRYACTKESRLNFSLLFNISIN